MLSETDRRIVNALQGGFPIVDRPFAEVAAGLELGKDELIERVARLCEDGVPIHEGREFLEQPIYVKLALTVAVLMLLYNISMTVLKGRKTAVSSVLLLGMSGAGISFLLSFYNPGNLVLDKIYWWWVVHI